MAKPIKPPTPSAYLTWDEGDDAKRAMAFAAAGDALQKVEPIMRGRGTNIYFDIAPGNVSVKDGFDRGDYEAFRPSEALPRTPKQSMVACNDAYLNVGIVRNIIDLMGDFAVQGIDINHPNERIEKFFKEWFRRVSGPERSERFLNYLYRNGNVLVKRQTAKLSVQDEDQIRKSIAAPDTEVDEPIKLQKREVPWRYTFLNPLAVKLMGEELAPFLGRDQFIFALEVPQTVAKKIKNPRTAVDKQLVANLPEDIVSLLKSGQRLIPLDSEKVRSFYYKRDDWQSWAFPMTHSILSDIGCLRKMKLADLAALDGAISCIRVWKLGNIEARIIPNETLIARLAEMLTNNIGGGVMDLIWGPDIELLETKTDVHHFLGETKYAPVLTAIYAGLGVPPTLTGAATQSGFTNNFISLQTLTERLEYGRTVIREFWEYEIRLLQRAMGFRFPATLVFDRMTLSDETAEKQLLINLADRDIISWESVVERFGETPEIESVRLKREARKRDSGQMSPKASPFHDPQQDFGLKKIFAQQGTVTPSELGLELDENDGQKTLIDHQTEQTVKQTKLQNEGTQNQNDHEFRMDKLHLKHGVHPAQMQNQAVKTGVPGQGRPKQSKDTKKRKQRDVKPRTSAEFIQNLSVAENSLAKIAEIVTPFYLQSIDKKNLRQLTEEQMKVFEDFKFSVLCQFDLDDPISREGIGEVLKRPLASSANVTQLYRAAKAKYEAENGREPPMEILRRFQAAVFALYRGDYE